MRNKKTLSIQDDVLERGQRRADEMFSGNFSMYITYLINKDIKGDFSPLMVNPAFISQGNLAPQLQQQPYPQYEENYKVKEEVACAIDNILGFDD